MCSNTGTGCTKCFHLERIKTVYTKTYLAGSTAALWTFSGVETMIFMVIKRILFTFICLHMCNAGTDCTITCFHIQGIRTVYVSFHY